MPVSGGSGSGPPDGFGADQAPSVSEGDDGLAQQKFPASTDDQGTAATTAIAEKTISCILCRGRKLKCDRVKPKCGTCTRLRTNCEYPERRRTVSSKRRNMKDLEARLAQVETKLISETAKSKDSDQMPWTQSVQGDWDDIPADMNIDFGNDTFINQALDMPDTLEPALPTADLWAQDTSGLDLQEPLPPDEIVNDLHQLYFEKIHYTAPMIHKQRYLASLSLPPHMQPPVCLRYAIWASAAMISEKYTQYEDIFYERARRYIDVAEMKNHGEGFPTVQNAQTCGLIATYEAGKAYFTRSWMTIGRMVRLVQMLGLHRLDSRGPPTARQVLPPPKDCIELEERRRTFWVAFHGDRWSSSGTGWSMLLQEKEIETNLPSSEESFENGIMESGISLQDALTPAGVSKISVFGGSILSACLFGHNFAHLRQNHPEDHPEDLANGDFWRRHRTMDNIISSTFMFLPHNLRLPSDPRDMRIVSLHMNLHTAAICLHQTAIVTAERHNLDSIFIRQIRCRSIMSAEEIVSIMRLVSHVDPIDMNTWTGFYLYAAASVFIQLIAAEDKYASSISNLEFLLAAMKAIGNRHSITRYFTTQLELDIENSGILRSSSSKLAGVPSNGFLAERSSAPKTIFDLCGYVQGTGATENRLKGPLLAGILSRPDQEPSLQNSPASALTPNINSTPSSNYPEVPVEITDDPTSFLHIRGTSFMTAIKAVSDTPALRTLQYSSYGQPLSDSQSDPFKAFQHDSTDSGSQY